MKPSPVYPAHSSRINGADEEIKRRKQEVLNGVLAALAAQQEGNDHPQLLTPQRREDAYLAELKRREHEEMAKRPPLPQIIVTQPVVEVWGDFRDTRRGRYGATLME